MGYDPDGTFSWKAFGMIVAAIAIVAVVAVATAATAGVAGAAIAGAAGFSTFGVNAVGMVVGTAALISGTVVGANEIANQIADKGAENINLLSVGISTVGGGIDGAFVAGSLFTIDPVKSGALWLGRTAFSGAIRSLYELSEGNRDQKDIWNKTLESMRNTALVGLLMFGSKPVTILSMFLKPIITGGIKFFAGIGKNIWKYFNNH